MDPGERVSDNTPTTDNQAEGQTIQKTHVTTASPAIQSPASQPLENQQEVVKLYQTSPPHLWPCFSCVLQFCDAVDEDAIDYHSMFNTLAQMFEIFHKNSPADVTAVAKFAVAAGFVSQAVKVIRELIGTGAVFGSSRTHKSPEALCGKILLNMLLNFTDVDNDIRLSLVKTEFFHDIPECLKLLRHLSPAIAEDRGICHTFLGIFHNSCKDPSVAATVKAMDIVPHLIPFLDRNRCEDVRLSVLALLAFIVDDTQLGCLEMDHVMLEYCTRRIQEALKSTNPAGRNGWEVEEIAVALALAARLEFNKRFIVAKEGVVELFKTVLQESRREDAHAALAVFAQLATDPFNAKLFQRNKGLVHILSVLQDEENGCHRETASNILTEIQEADFEEDDFEASTALSDVMEDQSNTLVIMGVGRLEFILHLLSTSVTPGKHARDCGVKCTTMLKALRELAQDESCQRELLAGGGLGLLRKILQSSCYDDILESCNLLLELAWRKEYCILIQADTMLMELLRRMTRHDSQHVRQTAAQLVDSIEYYTSSN